MTIIAPSLLAANPLNLAAEIHSVEEAGANWHHIDVMDGHFVPNLSFGLSTIAAIKKVSQIPLDVHIMIANPEEMIDRYIDAGSDILTFHLEATNHPHLLINKIQKQGIKAGVAVNPGTPIEMLGPLLSSLDLILVMSVNPGFGGQSYIEQTALRVKRLKHELKEIGRDPIIEVDGGITDKTLAPSYKAGANAFVAGSYIYGHKNRRFAIDSLKNICDKPA